MTHRYNFVQDCDIPSPPERKPKTPPVQEIRYHEIPVLLPPVQPVVEPEIPATLIASLLPCDQEGRYPCPVMEIDNTESETTFSFFDGDGTGRTFEGTLTVLMDVDAQCCCDGDQDTVVFTPSVSLSTNIDMPCPTLEFSPSEVTSSGSEELEAPQVELYFDVYTPPNTCGAFLVTPRLQVDVPKGSPNFTGKTEDDCEPGEWCYVHLSSGNYGGSQYIYAQNDSSFPVSAGSNAVVQRMNRDHWGFFPDSPSSTPDTEDGLVDEEPPVVPDEAFTGQLNDLFICWKQGHPVIPDMWVPSISGLLTQRLVRVVGSGCSAGIWYPVNPARPEVHQSLSGTFYTISDSQGFGALAYQSGSYYSSLAYTDSANGNQIYPTYRTYRDSMIYSYSPDGQHDGDSPIWSPGGGVYYEGPLGDDENSVEVTVSHNEPAPLSGDYPVFGTGVFTATSDGASGTFLYDASKEYKIVPKRRFHDFMSTDEPDDDAGKQIYLNTFTLQSGNRTVPFNLYQTYLYPQSSVEIELTTGDLSLIEYSIGYYDLGPLSDSVHEVGDVIQVPFTSIINEDAQTLSLDAMIKGTQCFGKIKWDTPAINDTTRLVPAIINYDIPKGSRGTLFQWEAAPETVARLDQLLTFRHLVRDEAARELYPFQSIALTIREYIKLSNQGSPTTGTYYEDAFGDHPVDHSTRAIIYQDSKYRILSEHPEEHYWEATDGTVTLIEQELEFTAELLDFPTLQLTYSESSSITMQTYVWDMEAACV